MSRRDRHESSGVTPFKGQKGEAWEGGYRAPMVVRWPGHIRPGTVKNQLFAALDWLPTLVDIAGGPKGDGLKQQIEAGNEGGQWPRSPRLLDQNGSGPGVRLTVSFSKQA
jgi:arylsulfatase A-like enzyme